MPSIKEMIKRSTFKSSRLNKNENIEFKSTNNLIFEIGLHFAENTLNFRVGTCTGVYSFDANNYIIIGIANNEIGNGHLQDVFDWFENSCIRDKKNLMIVEFLNKDFMRHLISKRGFVAIDSNNVIKYFNKHTR